MQVRKISEHAYLPSRSSPYAAGLDLASPCDTFVPAHGKTLIPLDLQIALPVGTYGRIASRSGTAWNFHISIGADILDADYRGNVQVMLFNHSKEDFHVLAGQLIAQLIVEKIELPQIQEVTVMSDKVLLDDKTEDESKKKVGKKRQFVHVTRTNAAKMGQWLVPHSFLAIPQIDDLNYWRNYLEVFTFHGDPRIISIRDGDKFTCVAKNVDVTHYVVVPF